MSNSSARSITFSAALPSPDEYHALFETTGWNGMYGCTPNDLMEVLRSSWHVESAYHDEKLVGVGRLMSDGRLYAVVFDVIVAPEWQRNGIGSAIMQRLLDRCRSAGIRDVLLFAAKGTQPFYQRFGFAPRPSEAPGMILRRTSHAG